MKYQLNKLPVKTTNSFKVNHVELDLTIPSFQMNHEFEIKGDISSLKITKEKKKENLSSKIGFDFKEYYEVNIQVPKGVQVKEPIFITYNFEKGDSLISQIQITYEDNSNCDFVLFMNSKDEEVHFSHLVEKVISSKSSSGNITFVNFLNSKSQSFYALENEVEENANIIHTIVDLGGHTRLYNVSSDLVGFRSMNTIHTLYIGQKDEVLDYQYYLKNIGKESNNQLKVEGALTDNSQKIFRGTIDFIKGCSQSIGEENENCILLSDTCRSRSLPQLLCGEEDVVGSHGVSSGRVSEDKLFYIMSRGYSKKDAERLIVFANFLSLLSLIPSEELRENIVSRIEEKLS